MLVKRSITTSRRNEFIDITSLVREAIYESALVDGVAIVFCPHTTAAITINENADPGVTADILQKLSSLVPLRDGYSHAEGNSDVHVKSSLVGASETVIIEQGTLVLGVWQSIYFCEFDGPRSRNVYIQTLAA